MHSQKLLFKGFMQKGQSKKFLDVLGYVLNLLVKLVSLNFSLNSPVKLDAIFGIATQFRIEALGKINGNYDHYH